MQPSGTISREVMEVISEVQISKIMDILTKIEEETRISKAHYEEQLEKIKYIHTFLSLSTIGAAAFVMLWGGNSGRIAPSVLFGSCSLLVLLAPADQEQDLIWKLQRITEVILQTEKLKASNVRESDIEALQQVYSALQADLTY